MPTTNVLLPHDIDLDKCIALNSSYTQARVDLAELPRLQESCVRIEGEVLADISFENDLNSMRLIHGHVVADVVLICQRCGNEYVEHLDLNFSLTPDLERAKAYNLEGKYDFFDADDASKIDLYNLIEDGLILEIPTYPKHDEDSPECELAGSDWSYGEIEKSESDNPFAALAALKVSSKNRQAALAAWACQLELAACGVRAACSVRVCTLAARACSLHACAGA